MGGTFQDVPCYERRIMASTSGLQDRRASHAHALEPKWLGLGFGVWGLGLGFRV